MAGNEVILLNRGCMGEPYVIENVCFVGSDESVDITIEQGRIADVRSSEKSVAKASKTWIIPGLWDCHTHFTQWSYTLGRLDLIDARSADEAMSLLRERGGTPRIRHARPGPVRGRHAVQTLPVGR